MQLRVNLENCERRLSIANRRNNSLPSVVNAATNTPPVTEQAKEESRNNNNDILKSPAPSVSMLTHESEDKCQSPILRSRKYESLTSRRISNSFSPILSTRQTRNASPQLVVPKEESKSGKSVSSNLHSPSLRHSPRLDCPIIYRQ